MEQENGFKLSTLNLYLLGYNFINELMSILHLLSEMWDMLSSALDTESSVLVFNATSVLQLTPTRQGMKYLFLLIISLFRTFCSKVDM